MKTQIETARKAGYSDQEIADFLSKDQKYSGQFETALQAGYEPKKILDFLHEKELPSKKKSVILAPIKGLIQGTNALSSLKNLGLDKLGLSPRGPITEQHGEKLLEENLPTRDEPAENFLQAAGQLLPQVLAGPEGLGAKALQLAGGTVAGQLARANEAGPVGQGIAEAAGMTLPGLIKGAGQAIRKVSKTPIEKLPSGISKPTAMEAKHAEKAFITPERQKKVIQGLNEEAANLTKKTIQTELPIAQKIEQGYDFESNFQKNFEQLRRQAKKFDPDINIKPIDEFLSKSASKYRGIPVLHEEGRKVMREIAGFKRRPESGLYNLLKTFRSNNQKRKSIFETAHVTGRQKEYVDFLGDMNRSIMKSIEETLPADSAWLKAFKTNNSDYSNYLNAIKTVDMLQPVLGQKASPAALERLATDPKKQARLKLAMGEKGAAEITQIAKDLKEAVTAIKRIPKKKFSEFDQVLPLSILVPHSGALGKALSISKAGKWLRRGYGYLLSTPKRRKHYAEALKAVIKQDKDAYQKAVISLFKDVNNAEQE